MTCPQSLCGIDTETTLIKNSYELPDLVIAGFCSGDRCELVRWQHIDEYLPQFLMKNYNTKLVFFNIAFDVDVMGAKYFIPELARENRMMELGCNYRQYLVATRGWIPGKVTLDGIVSNTLHVKLNKEDGTRTSFNREAAEFTEQQLVYLVEDCAATAMCGEAYNNAPTESIQARGAYVLSQITRNGLKVDVEHVRAKQMELVQQMSVLSTELRAFGFRCKGDHDDQSAVKCLIYVSDLLGIEGAERAIGHKKTVAAGYLWSLAAMLHQKISSGSALLSEVADIVRVHLDAIAGDKVEWNKKAGKDYLVTVKRDLADKLAEIDCDTCIVGLGNKPASSTKPALWIIRMLVEYFVDGRILTSMDAFNHDFYEEHEYFLGWLNVSDQKPLSPSKFVQQRLRQLMEDHPGLEFPLTKGATKAIRNYKLACRRKGVIPDQAEIKKLSVYAYSKADKWLLTDAGITDPFLEKYSEFKHAEKLLSTYFTEKYIEGDGRAHPKFNAFLNTGRTGCSSPNAQNLPKEKGLREQYIPEKGNVLVACDYGQEEIVTLAATLLHRYGKSRLADAVNLGIDVHSMFALYINHQLDGIDLSNLNKEIAATLKTLSAPYKEVDELVKIRSLCKIFSFGCGGGMQGHTMYINCRRQGFDITEDTATEYCNLWADMWSEVKRYFEPPKDVMVDASVFDGEREGKEEDNEEDDDDLTVAAEKVQLYRNCNILGMWRVRSTRNAVLNFPFQSLAAVVSKHALWKVFYWAWTTKLDVKIVNFIHDEIMVECPEEIASEVADTVQALMVEAAKDIMPNMFIKAEACMMRRWSKKAYEVRDEAGRMIPFEDDPVNKAS